MVRSQDSRGRAVQMPGGDAANALVQGARDAHLRGVGRGWGPAPP